MAYWSARTKARLLASAFLVLVVCVGLLPTQVTPNVYARATNTPIHVEDSWKGTYKSYPDGTTSTVTFKITSITPNQYGYAIKGLYNVYGSTACQGQEGTLSQLSQYYGYSLMVQDAINKWGKSPIDRYIYCDIPHFAGIQIIEGKNSELMGVEGDVGFGKVGEFTLKSRERLFILLQGINTALTPDDIAHQRLPGFDQEGGIVPFLKGHGFGDAQFMAYSYEGIDPQGQLRPYFCDTTFSQSIRNDEFRLDAEVTNYLKQHVNTDVYLVGHSLGGVVAFGYLAFLRAFKFSLPYGGRLAGVITLDAPIGGFTDNKAYFSDIKSYVRSQCDLFSNFQSVKDLMAIFKTAPSSHPQGGKASLKQVVFGGTSLTNQQLVDEALAHNIAILTIGNLFDFLWDTAACYTLPKVDFLSTQVLRDEGTNSRIYGRAFQGGDKKCKTTTILLGALNHLEVLTNSLVEKGLLDFLPVGTEPDPLKLPTKGF